MQKCLLNKEFGFAKILYVDCIKAIRKLKGFCLLYIIPNVYPLLLKFPIVYSLGILILVHS